MIKKDNEIYSKDELEFFQKIESEDYIPLENEEKNQMMNDAKVVAKNTIIKRTQKKPLNIRLFQDDILKIKAMALKE